MASMKKTRVFNINVYWPILNNKCQNISRYFVYELRYLIYLGFYILTV